MDVVFWLPTQYIRHRPRQSGDYTVPSNQAIYYILLVSEVIVLFTYILFIIHNNNNNNAYYYWNIVEIDVKYTTTKTLNKNPAPKSRVRCICLWLFQTALGDFRLCHVYTRFKRVVWVLTCCSRYCCRVKISRT